MLAMLVEPYRQSDRDEVTECLKTQGGLDACQLAYYAQGDIGKDNVWDNWRTRRPVVRVALPRRTARARVGQRGRRSEREAERLTEAAMIEQRVAIVLRLLQRRDAGRGGCDGRDLRSVAAVPGGTFVGRLYRWTLLLSVGVQGVYTFIGHVFFPE